MITPENIVPGKKKQGTSAIEFDKLAVQIISLICEATWGTLQ
jgi:hypothetical protein